ncbi:MAG: hypothetical protein LC644_05835, partial [Pseudonocardia sp.]|nr:hypothetical protein [Pseudonocardia sp.]
AEFGVAGIGVVNGPDRGALCATAAAATLSLRFTRRCSDSSKMFMPLARRSRVDETWGRVVR